MHVQSDIQDRTFTSSCLLQLILSTALMLGLHWTNSKLLPQPVTGEHSACRGYGTSMQCTEWSPAEMPAASAEILAGPFLAATDGSEEAASVHLQRLLPFCRIKQHQTAAGSLLAHIVAYVHVAQPRVSASLLSGMVDGMGAPHLLTQT